MGIINEGQAPSGKRFGINEALIAGSEGHDDTPTAIRGEKKLFKDSNAKRRGLQLGAGLHAGTILCVLSFSESGLAPFDNVLGLLGKRNPQRTKGRPLAQRGDGFTKASVLSARATLGADNPATSRALLMNAAVERIVARPALSKTAARKTKGVVVHINHHTALYHTISSCDKYLTASGMSTIATLAVDIPDAVRSLETVLEREKSKIHKQETEK